MTESEHRILHALEHPASARAVSRISIEWDGEEQTSELLDWSDIVFAMWRAGLLSPGATIGRISYWVLRAGWRSSAAMSDAVAPLVGPGWVEAVRRRVLRDVILGPSVGLSRSDPGGVTDWKFRHVFCAPGPAALTARLTSKTGHVSREGLPDRARFAFSLTPSEGPGAAETDHLDMGEGDYTDEVVEAIAQLDELVSRARSATGSAERRDIFEVARRMAVSFAVSDAVQEAALTALVAIAVLTDDALMNEIRGALASYRGAPHSERDLNRAQSLSASLRSPARLLEADAEVLDAVAHVEELVRLAAPRTDGNKY